MKITEYSSNLSPERGAEQIRAEKLLLTDQGQAMGSTQTHASDQSKNALEARKSNVQEEKNTDENMSESQDETFHRPKRRRPSKIGKNLSVDTPNNLTRSEINSRQSDLNKKATSSISTSQTQTIQWLSASFPNPAKYRNEKATSS